mmetsp:Transcript_22442/g.64484  ORF Transcript_22442/g.64484 Transcript_22442/m.64484 type:complete len:234 (-) Transcript_22442:44-745(-)
MEPLLGIIGGRGNPGGNSETADTDGDNAGGGGATPPSMLLSNAAGKKAGGKAGGGGGLGDEGDIVGEASAEHAGERRASNLPNPKTPISAGNAGGKRGGPAAGNAAESDNVTDGGNAGGGESGPQTGEASTVSQPPRAKACNGSLIFWGVFSCARSASSSRTEGFAEDSVVIFTGSCSSTHGSSATAADPACGESSIFNGVKSSASRGEADADKAGAARALARDTVMALMTAA